MLAKAGAVPHSSSPPPPPPRALLSRDWEFSWLARNLAPVRNQKIHWASEPGSASLPGLNIANRGQIRFVRRGPAATGVSLSISYEVPELLAPFASVGWEGAPGVCRRSALETPQQFPAACARHYPRASQEPRHAPASPPLSGPHPCCRGHHRARHGALPGVRRQVRSSCRRTRTRRGAGRGVSRGPGARCRPLGLYCLPQSCCPSEKNPAERAPLQTTVMLPAAPSVKCRTLSRFGGGRLRPRGRRPRGRRRGRLASVGGSAHDTTGYPVCHSLNASLPA